MIIDIEKKLNGTIPINKFELLELVNSWGRKDDVLTNDDIEILASLPKECYPFQKDKTLNVLSNRVLHLATKLLVVENFDVSKIEDLSYVFRYSYYNGDLSKWNVSNCINIERIFSHSDFNNNSLKNWNTSNIKNMEFLFYKSIFNGDTNEFKKKTAFLFKFFNEIFISLKQCGLNYDFVHKINSSDRQNYQTIMFDNKVLIRINKSKLSYFYSNWDVSNVYNIEYGFSRAEFDGDISKWQFQKKEITCFEIFMENNNFIDKYNNGNCISNYTKGFLSWFEENKEKIKELNTSKEEIFDFFSFDNQNIELDKEF